MSTTPTSPDPAAKSASNPPKPAPAAATAPKASGSPPQADEHEEEEEPSGNTGRFLLFNATPSWAVSAVVHFVLFIVLALMQVPEETKSTVTTISSRPPEVVEEMDEFKTEKIELDLNETAVVTDSSQVFAALTSDVAEVTETPVVETAMEAAPISVELSEFGEEVAPKSNLMKQVGSFTGSGVDSRSAAMRAQLGRTGGATEASERAVARALEWFARHQLADGGWNFDHRRGACNGRCSEPGSLAECRTGATAMALLPFLGAGQTHRDGKYKEVVNRGLYFLASQM